MSAFLPEANPSIEGGLAASFAVCRRPLCQTLKPRIRHLKELAIALLIALPFTAQATQISDKTDVRVEHEIIAKAFDSLSTRPGIEFTILRGWTVAHETASNNFWAFTPRSHHVLPALLKRTSVERDGRVHVDTEFLCLGPFEHCQVLKSESKKLFEEILAKLETKTQLSVPADLSAAPARR